MPANAADISTATQTVAYTGTAGTSTAFGSQTWRLKLVANSAAHYRISDTAAAATTGDAFLPASWLEYVACRPGQKVSVIRASTDGLVTATSGTLTVTELSE